MPGRKSGKYKKTERRERTAALIQKEEFWTDLFANISKGGSLSNACKMLDIPHSTVWAQITARADLSASYAQAKSARADEITSRIEQATEDVRLGDLDPHAGRVVIDSYKWLASKYYPRMYGEKQQIDIQVRDVNQQHLDEVRKLSVINPAKELDMPEETDVNTNVSTVDEEGGSAGSHG
jgi:hypothetical protein